MVNMASVVASTVDNMRVDRLSEVRRPDNSGSPSVSCDQQDMYCSLSHPQF